MTDITKKYKNRCIFFKILSISCTLIPLLIYTIIAFASGEAHEKVSLGLCLLAAIIFTGINIVFKYHIRSTVWLLLLGIHCCISNMTTLLLIIAVTTLFDEFIFTPLSKKYRQKWQINNEIDKRG